MRTLLELGALCAILPSLSAQALTTVVPSPFTSAEGSSWTAYPFGLGSQTRLQYLYHSNQVAVPVVLIRQIAIRGDATALGVAKTGVDLEIGLTTTPIDPWRASPTFASNLGADYKLSFTRKIVNLPAQPGGSPTAAFLTAFPLDVPFLYLSSGGNFLVDYIVHAQPAGSYSQDTNFISTAASIVSNGSPCGGLIQAASGGAGNAVNPVLSFALSGAPSGGSALHAIGAALLPAPLPLPFGGCPLLQDVAIVSPVTLAGTAGSISYPVLSAFKGWTIYGQGFAADAALTSISSSQSHMVTIGGYDPYTRIYNLSSATSATGSVQVGVGIVTQLTY